MQIEVVKKLIESGLANSKANITGDGSHFQAQVICADFAGKSLLQKQKMVMATVTEEIQSGELHALTIKTHTPDEWALLD